MRADVEIVQIQQVGLRLPDGTEIFPPDTWHGRGLTTNEDRKVVFDALAESASNLGMAADELVRHYAWIVREFQVITTTLPPVNDQTRPLNDAELTEVVEVEAELVDDEGPLPEPIPEPSNPPPIYDGVQDDSGDEN